MSKASIVSSKVMRVSAGSGACMLTGRGDAVYLLALRFIAHLSYFKIASALLLPQGLGTAGVVLATAVYATACLAASRWIAGLRRAAAEAPHPAALPLLGATAVFIAMMLTGPAIATLLPRHAELAVTTASLLPAWLALLAPVCVLFFAAQMLAAPRRRLLR